MSQLSRINVNIPSYVHGQSGPPLIGQTIGAFLDGVAAQHGGREAVVSVAQGIRWTYDELKQKSDAFAAGLIELGLECGDRLGIWAPNRAEWVVVQFATAKAGLILVNINPAYRVSELEHVLKASGCKALVIASRFKTSDYIAMTVALVGEFRHGTEPISSARLPALRRVIVLDDPGSEVCFKYSDVIAIGERVRDGWRDRKIEAGFQSG